jgi:2'-hydroxyisoflavone reductase
MRILVLGGTSFVGRAIVEDALAAGHTVTLFSRGLTGTDLFPEVERRIGDRSTGDYASLTGGEWEAVVDVSGYVPRHVQQAVEALGARAGRYLFISSGSVYDKSQPDSGVTEDSPRKPPEHDTEEVTGPTYGPLKVACEDTLLSLLGDRATIVRPGIVAGPHDSTDRFTYWVRRAAQGGRVAVPCRLDQPVQVVDSRDLARLVVALLEQDLPGAFNAVGPVEPVTLADLIRTCARAAGVQVELVAVPADAVEPGFPLVMPDPSWEVMFSRRAAAAHAAGMPATPLDQTAADVLAWDRERGTPPMKVGFTPEREAAVLTGL